MPDRVPDVPELFAELRRADVPLPQPERVAARGRQLRRRTWLQASAAAVAVIAGAAVAVHLVTGPGGRVLPAQITNSPTPTSPVVPTPARTTPPARTVLPPPGRGQLILGLNDRDQFVMTRTGSGAPAVQVPGLTTVAGGPANIATDPAGGWVVTYSIDPQAQFGAQTARLAVVTTDGHSYDFGPAFTGKEVTSVAVSPDGSRVAVALLPTSGSPLSGTGQETIEVLPTPGHGGGTRTWRIQGSVNVVDNLSWAPDGEHLTYAVGFQTGAGIDGYPVTLDVAAAGSMAPGQSGWPQVGKGTASPGACVPDVGMWLGTSGQFAALEECGASHTEVLQPANAGNGAPTGPAITIPGARAGSCNGSLNSAPAGNPVLITYCDVYLDDHGRLSKLPGGLTSVALAG
jgi:hypothetical protein